MKKIILNKFEDSLFNLDKNSLFQLSIVNDMELVGNIFVDRHPNSSCGAEVHLEIVPKWRKKWLGRELRNKIMSLLVQTAKEYKISTLYSTALTEVSPRLLEFFGFKEYYNKQPKTYYYLDTRG